LQIRIHNTETNEIIDRDMTDEEISQFELNQLNELKLSNELAEKLAAKEAAQAKLAALGLTVEDLQALGL
jgi:phosphopantetheinyl transferase (holo-ACP synthase)